MLSKNAGFSMMAANNESLKSKSNTFGAAEAALSFVAKPKLSEPNAFASSIWLLDATSAHLNT